MVITTLKKENKEEYIIQISGLDKATKDHLELLLRSVNKYTPEFYLPNYELVDNNEEDQDFPLGLQNTIQKGEYAGLTISEGFQEYGLKFVNDILHGDCLRGEKFTKSIHIFIEFTEFMIIQINSGLFLTKLTSKDLKETFGWLYPKDNKPKKNKDELLKVLADKATPWFMAEQMIYDPAAVEGCPQEEYNGLTVVEIYEKYTLSGIVHLMALVDKQSQAYKYSKEFVKTVLSFPEIMDQDEFLKAFEMYFKKEKSLEDALQMEVTQKASFVDKKRKELIKKLSN